MGIPAPFPATSPGLPPPGDGATAVLTGVITAVGPSQPFAFRGPMNLALFASINTALTTDAGSTAATVASATGLAAGAAINSVNVPPGTTVGSITGTAVVLAIPPISQRGVVDASTAFIRGLGYTIGLLGSTVTGPGIPANTTVIAITTNAVAPTNLSPGVTGVVQLSNQPTMTPVEKTTVVPQYYTFARTGNAITVSGADAAAVFTGAAITWTGTVQVERCFDGALTWTVCNIGGTGTLAQYTAGPVNISFGEPEKDVLYRLNCISYTSGTINYRISETGAAAESLSLGSPT